MVFLLSGAVSKEEAKKTILAKIEKVADFFMEKYNENITNNDNIHSILEFYNGHSNYVDGSLLGQKEKVDVKDLLKRSDIPYGKPNLSGAPTLDIKRLAEKVKDYFSFVPNFKINY